MNMNTNNLPNYHTVTPLIDMFGLCPMLEMPESYETVKHVFNLALKKGYVIDPVCINKYSMIFIDDVQMDYNSTFYKTWNDVTEKDRLELFIDQLLHYSTTYGADFLCGNGYVPNDSPANPNWNTYKSIKPVTFADLYVKCMQMLSSGVALKSDTVKVLTDYVIEYCNYNGSKPDVDAVKNREAMVILCDALEVLPKDGSKLFAHIIYKLTGETMIVKNREMRNRIKAALTRSTISKTEWLKTTLKSLNNNQLIALAGVFNRYKELFLSFKDAESITINKVVNKIGHLSKKHHKPMQRGFWETVLHSHNDLETLKSEAEKATNFKLIQVMQSIRERLLHMNYGTPDMVLVRNGKVFIKDNTNSAEEAVFFKWEQTYNVCRDQLIRNLSQKACKVKLPKQYTLACPTSEKNFIGDFPMGTSCQMGENSVIGIYWRNDWGTRDFDLSFNDVLGNRIGWNSAYYDEAQSVIYSGDITNAPNGANEVLHFRGTEKNPIPNGVVHVNRYNGEAGSKYRIFFGTDELSNIQKADTAHGEYMVDPNNLQLEAEIKQDDMSQQTLGMVIDNNFYFYNLSCGYGAVTNAIRHKLGEGKFRYDAESMKQSAQETIDIIRCKTLAALPLESLLVVAGFEIVESEPDIDLTQLDRGTLIELFSK